MRNFPKAARQDAGFQLDAIQRGRTPSDYRSMSSIGHGVYELRIHTGGAFRVIYVARFEEAIYVLHAFQKKTQRTAPKDLTLATQRFKQLIKARRTA